MIYVLFYLSTVITGECSHLQVFQHRHARKDTPGLWDKGHAQAYNITGQPALNRLSLKLYRAFTRAHQAKNSLHGRRLAGCICSQQADDLALIDFKRNMFEHLAWAIIGIYII